VDPLDGTWHILNFLAPGIGIGLFAAAITRLLWYAELRGTSWLRLWMWGSIPAVLMCAAGLVVFGRDGKMATYGAMVAACAGGVWWAAFVRRR